MRKIIVDTLGGDAGCVPIVKGAPAHFVKTRKSEWFFSEILRTSKKCSVARLFTMNDEALAEYINTMLDFYACD